MHSLICANHGDCGFPPSQDELQDRIEEWFADRPSIDMQLEYNQRELASRVWHWTNGTDDAS